MQFIYWASVSLFETEIVYIKIVGSNLMNENERIGFVETQSVGFISNVVAWSQRENITRMDHDHIIYLISNSKIHQRVD